jgi:hypothetical protein
VTNYKIQYTLTADDRASRSFQRMEREMEGMERSTQRLGDSMNGLGRAIGGAVAALGFREVIAFGAEMRQTGDKVRVVGQSFNELTSEIGGADAVLADLVGATGGVLTNLQAMTVANQLLLTGVASSSDEISSLASSAIKLGAALDQGPNEAVQNLNAALLNNSYARLDTLGVSAANVRARVEELKNEGLDMSEAFKQATIEEMQVSLERLGPAAETSASQVGLLETKLRNVYELASRDFTTGLEGLAGMVNLVDEFGYTILFNPEDATSNAARDRAKAITDAFLQEMGRADMAELDSAVADLIARELTNAELGIEQSIYELVRDAGLMDPSELAYLGAAQNYAHTYNSDLGRATTFTGGGNLDERSALSQQALASAGVAASEARADAEERARDAMRRQGDAYADMLNKQGIAIDNANELKEAVEGMNLSELLGQGSGGRMGEIADMIAAANTGSRAALFTEQADIATGRETTASLAMDDVAQNIATLPIEDQIVATQNLADALTTMAETGVNISTLGIEELMMAAGVQQAAPGDDIAGYMAGASYELVPQETGGPLGEAIGDLETRSGLITDVRNSIMEISTATAPDLSAEATGLATSERASNEIKTAMDYLRDTKFTVDVEYVISVTGDDVPSGAKGPATSISGGEV